jgi:redox-sensitive bicupin YhaK (pirin superfamily)
VPNKKNIIAINQLGQTWQTLDPFLFSVHHLDHYPAGNDSLGPVTGTAGRNIGQDFGGKDGWSMYHGQNVPGFPHHPHRGFETITVVERGFADHTDSLGATGRFGKGDVQWMTAGKGVNHAEMFPLLDDAGDNTLELFQIWLNLPKKNKMVDPNYQMLWSEDIPVINGQDAAGKKNRIKVIAGQFSTTSALTPPPHSWASESDSELAIWLVSIEAGGTLTIPAASSDALNRILYLYNGDGATVSGVAVDNYRAVQVKPKADITVQAGDKAIDLLLLQGRPIGEPVAQHGPFVMNTQEEIQEAFAEYRATQFGGWPWPSTEYVHPRGKDRFAKYPDGRVEEKG